ncbi:MAG: hypothetical protein P8098_11975 [Candidatus Thiodiazotropha sp.]
MIRFNVWLAAPHLCQAIGKLPHIALQQIDDVQFGVALQHQLVALLVERTQFTLLQGMSEIDHTGQSNFALVLQLGMAGENLQLQIAQGLILNRDQLQLFVPQGIQVVDTLFDPSVDVIQMIHPQLLHDTYRFGHADQVIVDLEPALLT